MIGQLKELLGNYGKIDLFWWDSFGHAPNADGSCNTTSNMASINYWHADSILALVKKLQPSIINNNRCSYFFEPASLPQLDGDFDTPEQYLNGSVGTRLWESCMTMNDNWGYTASDNSWKSSKTLIRTLVQCAVNNGNFLLNIGPKSDGTIPQQSIDRLAQIGLWTAKYGESIYGTRNGPVVSDAFGGSTCKGNTIYIHLIKWTGSITLKCNLPGNIVSSRSLNGGTPSVTKTATGITISLPTANLDTIDNIIALQMDYTVLDTTPVINDDEPVIKYTGNWNYNGNRENEYYRDIHETKANGDYFELTFAGTEVEFLTTKSSNRGDVDMYIDGVLSGTVSCVAATETAKQSVFKKGGLSSGTHVLKGVKKSGTYLTVDAFKVVVPVSTKGPELEKPAMPTAHTRTGACKVFGDRVILADEYAGKTVRVTLFSLGGKLIRQTDVKGRAVNISRDFGVPRGAYIVRAAVVR